MYSSSSTGGAYRRNQHQHYDVANMTHCDCRPPHQLIEKVAWTPTNPGRRFKSCPTRRCKVYGFLDPELPSQYYIDLLYREHKEKERLMNEHGFTGSSVANSADSSEMLGLLEKDVMELKRKSNFHEALMLLVALVLVIFFIMFVKLG